MYIRYAIIDIIDDSACSELNKIIRIKGSSWWNGSKIVG